MKVWSTKNIPKSIEKYCLGGSKIEENRSLERSWGRPGTSLDFERHLGVILASSWHHLGAILAPSRLPNPTKIYEKVGWKSIDFLNPFLRWISSILERFWFQKPLQNEASEDVFFYIVADRRKCDFEQQSIKKAWFFHLREGTFSLFWELFSTCFPKTLPRRSLESFREDFWTNLASKRPQK